MKLVLKCNPMDKVKITGATIPYQLRPHKAIERNLFIDLLKKLDSSNSIILKDYRYVGFGAAFLEDFKLLHLEIDICDMDCIEMDEFAYSRQLFNNPYYFVNIHNLSSTKYIDDEFKFDKNQVIWLDYAMPRYLRQQLKDIELVAAKVTNLDVLKFTFNAKLGSFISSHYIKNDKGHLCKEMDYKTILKFLKDDPTYQLYLPDNIEVKDLLDFSSVIRAMAIRAINRGILAGKGNLKFQHIASFLYADGQEMTTITGIISSDEEFNQILEDSKLSSWKFYLGNPRDSEFISPIEISVPAMTISERVEIDRKIPTADIMQLANDMSFFYGTNEEEHRQLMEGYITFYKYLPYYSKVIY
jgi:hypothetical protein